MMRLLTLIPALLFWVAPAFASEKVERLALAMHLMQAMDIIVDEGDTQRQELDKTLLDNSGGEFFEAQVEDIFDPVWMRNRMTDAFEVGLTDAQLDQAIVFFESDLGQTIITLENSARRAFLDETIEDMAREAYENASKDDVHYELVDEFIQVNDLIDLNVQGALSADYNFFKGLKYGPSSDDAELLAQLLAEQDAVTADTTSWVYSFLLMAYAPLDETQMREYIAFSRTETGKALNDALFDGFDRMFDGISFRLGEAVAQVLNAPDL